MNLISHTNKYIANGSKAVNPHLIEKIAKWITSMMKIFGVADNGTEIGFGSSDQSNGNVSYEMIFRHFIIIIITVIVFIVVIVVIDIY